MSGSVKFIDHTENVKGAITERTIAVMHECGGELKSQIQRNSRVDTGKTKGDYKYRVLKRTANRVELNVGSNNENAIWEEYGTGEYAEDGSGRKSGWVYIDAKGKGHFTKGKTANRPMRKAYTSLRERLISRIKASLGQIGG